MTLWILILGLLLGFAAACLLRRHLEMGIQWADFKVQLAVIRKRLRRTFRKPKPSAERK